MLFVTENITTIYSAEGPTTTTGQTSLEEIYNQAEQDTAFVTRSNRFYRWYGSITTAADGESVVIPKGFTAAQPGRWLRQGFPGPGGIRIPRGALTASGRAHVLMKITELVGGGGAPDTSFTATLTTSAFMFDQTTAIAIGCAQPNPAASPFLPIAVAPAVRNNRVFVHVFSPPGTNLAANTRVDVWVLRADDRIAQPAYTV
jgi:hypothetical protein